MTLLQQEAHEKIDRLSDSNIRFLLTIIDSMQTAEIPKLDPKKEFLKTAGSIDIDEDAVNQLRECGITSIPLS